MRFSDIPGHDDAKREAAALVDSGRVPHAILVSGPPGIGKLSFARALAQYIHCGHRHGGDSCGQCPACRQHAALNYPDVHYVYPAVKRDGKILSADYAAEWKDYLEGRIYSSQKEWGEAMDAGNSQPQIYVNEAMEIIRGASLSSYSADKKIYIIWLPEKMNPATANKLLKIFEEPFDDTVFILVSDEPALVLPTILSRMRRLELRRLDGQSVTDMLVSKGIDVGKAMETARLAEGIPAKAIEMAAAAGETALWGESFMSMMRLAYSRNVGALKELSEQIAKEGRPRAIRFLEYCSRQIRENFIYNLHAPELNLLSEGEERFSSRFAPFINPANVEGIAGEIHRASSDISRNANAKIVLLDMMLKLMILIHKKPDSSS